MDKVKEALTKLLPADQIGEVSDAITSMLEDAKQELEAEYNEKLNGAYAELHEKMKEAEAINEQANQEAYAVITDLRNRLDTQRKELTAEQESGFEEAYQMLQAEKAKNEQLEVAIYEQYDKKLAEMKGYLVDKVDQFLQFKGQELYEQARRDILNDPKMAEHKLTLDRVVDTVAEYISDEDYSLATNKKVEEAKKEAETLRSNMKILEARNIRLSTENSKLNEQVKQNAELLTEAKKTELKERVQKAEQVTGRGVIAEGIILETKDEPKPTADPNKEVPKGFNEAMLHEMQVLAGTRRNED